MKFVVTAKGFLKNKSTTVVDKTVKVEFSFTHRLREARTFPTRGKAEKFMKENDLQGFVYNPLEQEAIPNRYVVAKRHNYPFEEEKHLINEWVVQKAHALHLSDLRFLESRNDLTETYSKEEAIKICLEKNIQMLKELKSKIFINEDIYFDDNEKTV